MKKIKLRKGRIVIAVTIFFAIWIVVGIFILNHQSNEDKLRKIGYSSEELTLIKEHLNDNSLNALTYYSYRDDILIVINHDDFIEKHLSDYLAFLKKNQKASIDDTILLVNSNNKNIAYSPDISNIINHSDFDILLIDRYLAYYTKHEIDADKVILAVNSDMDKEDILVDDIVALFLGKEYFLHRNLDRYKDYYTTHTNLDANEIIRRVNSNLDKTVYKDVAPTDTSKGILLLVNKYFYLNSDYVPKSLVDIASNHGRGQITKEAYDAYIKMYDDAKKENLNLYIQSSYRSYQYQDNLYAGYVSKDSGGTASVDTYSARPGYSEHQTGLTFDLATFQDRNINNFNKKPEFKWVKDNAYKYGFILRFPLGKEYITGYDYEPWHYRYIGVEAATFIYEKDITFEEYYEYYVK